METKNSLDVIKEMTCKIKEATECLVGEETNTEHPIKWGKIDIEFIKHGIPYKFNVNAPVGYKRITDGNLDKGDYVFDFRYKKMKKPDVEEVGFPVKTYWWVMRKEDDLSKISVKEDETKSEMSDEIYNKNGTIILKSNPEKLEEFIEKYCKNKISSNDIIKYDISDIFIVKSADKENIILYSEMNDNVILIDGEKRIDSFPGQDDYEDIKQSFIKKYNEIFIDKDAESYFEQTLEAIGNYN